MISNHYQYDNDTLSLAVQLVDATQSDTKYSYNYKTDWKQNREQSSWSTRPIQPTSLYDDNHNHNDITTIMSTDTSIQSTLFQKNYNNNDNKNQDSINNNFVRKSKITIHENDNTNCYNDDDNLVQWSLVKKRQQRQQQNMYSTTNQHYYHQLTSPPTLDVSYQSEPTTTSISSIPYDNNQFNEHEQSNHYHNYKKTGTTIVGIAGKNYCILGADTRATSNTIVADKYCYKLHPLSQNCAAAGAGTSADLDHITRECYYQIQLWYSSSLSSSSTNYHSPWIGNDPIIMNTTISMSMIPYVPVRQICRYIQQRLYEQHNHCQANLIIGGIDNNMNNNNDGCGILRAIHPSGNIDIVPYTALGSGSYAAMSILENGIHQYQSNNNNENNIDTDNTSNNNYNENNDHHHEYCNIPLQDAIELVVKAVKAGIDNDLGSGSQVDICIITSSENGTVVTNYTRCYLPGETYTTNTNDNRTISSSPSMIIQQDNNHHSTTTSNNTTNPLLQYNKGVNGFGNVPYVIRSKRTFLLHNNNNHHYHINNNVNHKNDTIIATTGIPKEQWNDIIP